MIFNIGTGKYGEIIQGADAARDAKKYRKAALLYQRALRRVPDNAAIHIQCAHMFKEAGDLVNAGHHYLRAKELAPDDADLMLQLGHFYKVAGRLAEAEQAYRRAIELAPEWAEPVRELARLPVARKDAGGGLALGRNRRVERILRQAHATRDAEKYSRAAALYEQALGLVPGDPAVHIQCGHMFKEAGDLRRAEHHYIEAQRLTPADADLALQLGHFYKIAGRLEEAERSFKKAIDLDPGWPEPAIQLTELYRLGWRNHTREAARHRKGLNGSTASGLAAAVPESIGVGSVHLLLPIQKGLVPELAPRAPESMLHGHIEEIAIRSLGRLERTYWGMRRTLRGVAAIQGSCISATPIIELRATLNGLRFYSETIEQGFPLKYENYDTNKRKYVFNIWYNFSHFTEGLYDLQLQFLDENGDLRVHAEQIAIDAPLSEDQYPNSDRLVSVSGSDNRPLEDQINSQPSMIRPAKRTLFAAPPRNVLIQRVDQIGDIIVSIPAVRRLRELLPGARFVGLLSLDNAELARSLNLFDEIIAVDFPDDEWERRRIMPLDEQYKLRRKLESFKFDVAIDLSVSERSRPLLLLSGAPYLLGFKDEQSPWLSAYVEGCTRDPMNGRWDASHSSLVMGLVEWFGAILGSHSRIIQRDDLARDRLTPYGILDGDRFAVLHSGARIKYSRWPYYDKLASMILEQTELKVVMMSDDPLMRSRLQPDLAAADRFLFFDKRLPFDDLDAFLSFCTVFVGNDSGPGHLASLRGANVVNLFLARKNWNEWGVENRGYVISRRVPCAGCDIYDDPEECGKGFACITNISPEEVFRTVMKFV